MPWRIPKAIVAAIRMGGRRRRRPEREAKNVLGTFFRLQCFIHYMEHLIHFQHFASFSVKMEKLSNFSFFLAAILKHVARLSRQALFLHLLCMPVATPSLTSFCSFLTAASPLTPLTPPITCHFARRLPIGRPLRLSTLIFISWGG